MSFRFNTPPGWPAPPSVDWLPPAGWEPDPSWPPMPAGWQLIVPAVDPPAGDQRAVDRTAVDPPAGDQPTSLPASPDLRPGAAAALAGGLAGRGRAPGPYATAGNVPAPGGGASGRGGNSWRSWAGAGFVAVAMGAYLYANFAGGGEEAGTPVEEAAAQAVAAAQEGGASTAPSEPASDLVVDAADGVRVTGPCTVTQYDGFQQVGATVDVVNTTDRYVEVALVVELVQRGEVVDVTDPDAVWDLVPGEETTLLDELYVEYSDLATCRALRVDVLD